MVASTASMPYYRSAEASWQKLPSVLLLLTNGLFLGAGLRYAIIRLFIQKTPQIETQRFDELKDVSKSEADSTSLRHDDPIRQPLHNNFTEEHGASPKQFVVSIRGLKNRGQTCYCNSTLQALASLKHFYYHLESMQKSGSNAFVDALHCTIRYVNGHEVVAQKKDRKHFSSTFIQFLSSGSSHGDPKTIMDMIAKHHSQFRSRNNLAIAGTNEQQDSHEFLSALMDVLSVEERSLVHPKTKSSQEGSGLIHSQILGEELNEHLKMMEANTDAENEYNELEEEKKYDDKTNLHHQSSNTEETNEGERTALYQHNPFDGWLGSTIKCASCQHIRPIRIESFICLSLPIAMVRSEYLEDFLATEYGGFATAERVSDVQCVACAIKDKLEELEEEAMLLMGAISSLERRNKGKKDQAGLESELVCLNRHTSILKGMDADNDDEIQHHNDEDISFNIAGLVGLPKIIPMRGDAYKATLIMRPPKVLCIHIQRRHFDVASQQMVKISRRVHFPEVFDLSKFCAYAENSFEKEYTIQSSNWPKLLPYQLMSVVEHKGSAFGGHYQTYRRVGSEQKKWVLVSDESVLPRSWEEVQRCEAYMLLYEEMTPSSHE